jgi:hypothetical protein
MRRRAKLLCATAVVGLAIFGFIAPSGRAVAEDLLQFFGRKAQEVGQAAAQVLQFEQQFGPQFRQLYKTELHFMRLVCQPTKEQYDRIAADGEPALKATMVKFAATWNRPVPHNQNDDLSDPRALIVSALAQSVRSNLSSEQAARYQAELDQRAAARQRITVLNLVSKMDKLLILTTAQREKLGEILKENWHEEWNQPQWLTIGGQWFPTMPDDKILPVLTETQKNVWRDTQKGNIRFGFHLGMMQMVELGDEVWDFQAPAENAEPMDGKAVTKNGPGEPAEKK